MYKKHALGKAGEDFCVQMLSDAGYEILYRNFRSPYGEIDIVARDGQAIAFIEVKTRTRESLDHTSYSITFSKQCKLTKTAMFFMGGYENREILEYRFDVIILKKRHEMEEYDYIHLKNAFEMAEIGEFFP